MEQQEKNEWAQQEQEIQEGLKGKSFWYADWGFPILVGIMSAAIFAGTHMYVVYGVGAFNEVSIVAMLKAGLDGGSYGAAAAFGASFLFARILEGSLVGILDLGGSILTGIGIGVPAIFLSMGIKAPVENFGLALLTGAILGLAVGGVIVLIRKFTINQGNSTFGADVMMAVILIVFPVYRKAATNVKCLMCLSSSTLRRRQFVMSLCQPKRKMGKPSII